MMTCSRSRDFDCKAKLNILIWHAWGFSVVVSDRWWAYKWQKFPNPGLMVHITCVHVFLLLIWISLLVMWSESMGSCSYVLHTIETLPSSCIVTWFAHISQQCMMYRIGYKVYAHVCGYVSLTLETAQRYKSLLSQRLLLLQLCCCR